jgi:hypothetical protein
MTTMESIEPLLERLLSGAQLDSDEREALAASKDLLSLGMAADELRRRRHGNRITFVRVAMVPIERASDATWEAGAGEIRLTGVPAGLGEALVAVGAVRARAAEVPVTGFSLADIVADAGSDAAAGDWCRQLASAGLSGLAEAPLDRLDRVEAVIGLALEAGLAIGALTVQQRPPSLVPFFERVTTVVATHPAVSVCAPLPGRITGVSPTTGYEDVHLVALARLLTPVAHIQVDWQRYGPKLAQVALTFGADDIDAVSPADDVAEGRRRAPLEEIRRNIRAASCEPVERDARFRPR